MYEHIVMASTQLPSGVSPAALLKDTPPEALEQIPQLAALAEWLDQQHQQEQEDGGVGPSVQQQQQQQARQQELRGLLEELHTELRGCCDMMFIGSNQQKSDTVVEVSIGLGSCCDFAEGFAMCEGGGGQCSLYHLPSMTFSTYRVHNALGETGGHVANAWLHKLQQSVWGMVQ